MPQLVHRWKLVWGFFLVAGLWATPAWSDVMADYTRDITADYDRISDTLNSDLGRVFGFYSTLGWNDGPSGLDLIKGPHVEFGGDVGADFVKIHSKDVPLTVLSPDSNVDIPSSLPLPFPVWHARVGIWKGLDFGFRATGYPRIEKNQVSTANRGLGFALRYNAIHGLTLPDVSVQVTWDRMRGDASFSTDVNQQAPYNDGGATYTGSVSGQTIYREIWDVHSFGVKVMVGKSVGIFHPYGAVGIQRSAGSIQSNLGLDLNGTLTDSSNMTTSLPPLQKTLARSAVPPITQPKYMVGFELGEGFYWSNLFETNGRDYAVSTGFRAKI
jgi:hypothetical protein